MSENPKKPSEGLQVSVTLEEVLSQPKSSQASESLMRAEDARIVAALWSVTKEGIAVVPGQLWRSLDCRERDRLVVVRSVQEHPTKPGQMVAHVQHYSKYHREGMGTITRISISRMHKHSTGWALVEEVPSPKWI